MIRENLKNVDMLHGPLAPNIFRFAIPLALTGILQQLFNAADLAVVGQFVGKEAMAAVGSNTPIINLIVNLFVGISLGTNIVIAQASGRHDEKRIRLAVHSSILFALIAGAVMAVAGVCFSAPLISALDVPEDVYPMALTYLRIYYLGMPVILLYNFEAAIFRSRGHSQIPLLALTISGVINVLLNLFFVIVLKLSVSGVALATVISNLISSAILFGFLLRSDDLVRVDFHSFRIDPGVLKEILRIGVPAGVQSMLFALANIIIQSSINGLGSTIMAASSAAYNVEIIAYYVLNAYGQTCSTFVGQNYGAGQARRCRKVLKVCTGLSFLSTGLVFGLILIFGHQLLGLFNRDPGVISYGMIRLEFLAAAYIFSIQNDAFSGYLRGFGISQIPAYVSIFGICGLRLAWMFFVFPHNPTFTTILQVYPISLATTAILIELITLFIRPSRKYIRQKTEE